jgi:hypothetical protein
MYKQRTRNQLFTIMYDACDLAPGETLADRYEPADQADQTRPEVSAAELAAWEANPWF